MNSVMHTEVTEGAEALSALVALVGLPMRRRLSGFSLFHFRLTATPLWWTCLRRGLSVVRSLVRSEPC